MSQKSFHRLDDGGRLHEPLRNVLRCFLRHANAIPASGRDPHGRDGSCGLPLPFSGLLTVERAGDCSRGVDDASAALPSAAPFFELTGLAVGRMAGFAFLPMTPVKLDRDQRSM